MVGEGTVRQGTLKPFFRIDEAIMFLKLAVGLIAGSASWMWSPASAVSQQSARMTVDPAAISAGERMMAYLRDLQSFEVRADATVEHTVSDSQKVTVKSRSRILYRAPDNIFADWVSGGTVRRLFYDGNRLTADAPLIHNYGTVEQTGSVADVLGDSRHRYGLAIGLTEIMLRAWSKQSMSDFDGAMSLGAAQIAGVDTDGYFFRMKEVDWQVWIERGATPLPRKIIVTDNMFVTQGTYSAVLQWNANPVLPDEVFAYRPSTRSWKVEFIELLPTHRL